MKIDRNPGGMTGVRLPMIKVGPPRTGAASAPPASAQDAAITALQRELASVKRSVALLQKRLRNRSIVQSAADARADDRLARVLQAVSADHGIGPEQIIGWQRSPGALAQARLAFCETAAKAGFTHRQIGAAMSGRSAAAISTLLKRGRTMDGGQAV